MSVWKYVRGYVKISIKGAALERLVNRAVIGGVSMWDVKRLSAGVLEAYVDVRGFRRLRSMTRGLDCSVALIEKRGLPFFFNRNRARPVLLWGWLAVAAAALIASRFVWIVRVEGCSAVSESEVFMAAEAFGISVGVPKASFAPSELGAYIAGCDSRIAWAGATLSGIVLTIEVVESDVPPAVQRIEEPRSVYASKSGVIVRVRAYTGSPAVYEGAVVSEGDLLISGLVGTEERPMAVAAAGEVLARVAYTFVGRASADEMLPVRSGASEPYALVELPFAIWGERPEYASYELVPEAVVSGGRGVFPFTYTRGVCYELADAAVADKALLLELAAERANAAMESGLPRDAVVVSKQTETAELDGGAVRVVITVETEEAIGEYRPIVGQETYGTEQN